MYSPSYILCNILWNENGVSSVMKMKPFNQVRSWIQYESYG